MIIDGVCQPREQRDDWGHLHLALRRLQALRVVLSTDVDYLQHDLGADDQAQKKVQVV